MAELTWKVSRDENGDTNFVHANGERGIFIRVVPDAGPKALFTGHARLHGRSVWKGGADSLESAADRALEAIKSAKSSDRKSNGGEVF